MGTDLPGIDFVQLAKAQGCDGVRVTKAAELESVLRACAGRNGSDTGGGGRRLTTTATHYLIQGLETCVSCSVMNSSSTGTPFCVCSMPRLMAGMMSSAFVTRSP